MTSKDNYKPSVNKLPKEKSKKKVATRKSDEHVVIILSEADDPIIWAHAASYAQAEDCAQRYLKDCMAKDELPVEIKICKLVAVITPKVSMTYNVEKV